jgi:hypothetical protein
MLWAGICSAEAYRSFKVLIQNQTNGPLTIEAYSVLRGTWVEGRSPQQGQEIEKETVSMPYITQSNELGVGTTGMLYLAGSGGKFISITWNMPWAGVASYRVESHDMYHVAQSVLENEDPNNLVWLLTFTSSQTIAPAKPE